MKKFSIILLTLFCINSCKNTELTPPNILLIVADDMGYNDLSCYGNDFIESPNIDLLASEGILFTDAYSASALCSPSRACLMTGLHPVSTNITEHIHGNHPAPPSQKLLTPFISQHLNPELETLPELLKNAGYHTAHIGKWHLGGGSYAPQFQGYDICIGGSYNGLPKSFFYPFFNPGEMPELEKSAEMGDYLSDVLTDKAIEFILNNTNNTFFLSLNYYAPHVPIEAKKDLVKKYRDKRGNDDDSILPNVHYAAMIDAIDQNVGRILETLQNYKLDKNTIIVFTSDNGGLSVREVPAFAKHTPPTDNGVLREGKGYLYEGGIRVPLIISWADKLECGKKENTPVSGQDLFNTFGSIAGIKNVNNTKKGLLPLLEGGALDERTLLWHLPHYSPQGGKPSSALRKGDWKIIYHYESDSYELYKLSDDIQESKNLISEKPGIFNEMKKDLWNELRRINANYPQENPNNNKL